MDQVIVPQASLLAGAAQADITPKVGTYHRMWGAALHERSTGVHRPLSAAALWLQPRTEAGGVKDAVLLLALDHCILEKHESDALREAAARATGLTPEQIHVSLSHTHAAGMMTRSRADLPGGDLIGPSRRAGRDDRPHRRRGEVAGSPRRAVGRLRTLRHGGPA